MSHLTQFLEQHTDEIISEATHHLRQSHLGRTQAKSLLENQPRLAELYHELVESLVGHQVDLFVKKVEAMAQTCFVSGLELHEMQVIFNVLEETLWKQIAHTMAPAEMVEALGAVSTILGVGKDTLATTYITLAARAKEPTLDVTELFKGT